MSAALNNVTTANGYSSANTLSCPGAVRLVIDVDNAAIYYQRGIAERAGGQAVFTEPEVFLSPSARGYDRRCDAVRVRSAAAGVAAQVTIEALTAEEVGGG